MRMLWLFIAAAIAAAACSRHPFERFFANGERHLAARQYADAAIEFLNATRVAPGSVEAQMKLAEAYAAMGRTALAASAYERACSLGPSEPGPCLQAAAASLKAGLYETAAGQARGALAIDHDSFDAQLLLASALAGVGRFAEAEERLRATLATSSDSSRVYRALGDVQRMRGNAAAAQASLQRALDLDPSNVGARVSLSQVYLQTGRTALGAQELRNAIASDPNDVEANRAYATFLVESDKCEDAETYWQQVAANSTDTSGPIALADFYVWSHRPDAALRVLSEVPASRDGDGGVRTRLASLLYERGDKSEASALVDAVMAGDQTNVSAWLLKARIALDAGDRAAAREFTHEAMQLAPSDPAVRTMQARISEVQ